MPTKIKKNIEKGKKSVWFSGGEGLRGIEHMGASPPAPLRMARGVVCEVTPIGLLVWGMGRFFSHACEFFLSQSAQSSRSFLRTVSSPQNASGIQRSQRPFN